MNQCAIAAIVIAVGGAWTPAVIADWNPGDPHKMHWPQLPDPNGWDVNMTWPKVLADDWLCTQTGPVTDIHFWISFERDILVPIHEINVSIHADIPAPWGQNQPGPLLWYRKFSAADPAVRIRRYGSGPQGFFDAKTGYWNRPDHFEYYQVNLMPIVDPFYQVQGTRYWLDLSIKLEPGHQGRVGWKTSRDRYGSGASWQHQGFPPPWFWEPLHEPITFDKLDLAFVITPAPGALALLGLASILVARRRR
jgi:hypothetical protein